MTAVAADQRAFVYLESRRGDRSVGYAVELTPYGERLTSLTELVSGFSEPFGEVAVTPTSLLVPVIRPTITGESIWEVWEWASPDPPSRLIECRLPPLHHGQIFVQGETLFALFEDHEGNLRGFSTPMGEPRCPEEGDVALVASAPLPARYRLDNLGDRVALSGQTGESYIIRLFGRDLEPERQLRLANRAAPDSADLRVYDLEAQGAVAIYGARSEGACDIYLSQLSQLTAGPLPATRIVMSAEVERYPRLYETEDWVVVSWSVRDEGGGDHVELAAILPEYRSARPGGEVLWRHHSATSPMFASVWTSGGLLRVWIADGTLVVSPYRPSFWRR